jgi:hypothetical protein
MSLDCVQSVTSKLQEESLSALRDYFNVSTDALFTLFHNCVYNQEWATKNPVLSLKAFALLDPRSQGTEESLTILRIIFAAKVLIKDTNGIVAQILTDAISNKNWVFVFKLIECGVSKDFIWPDNQTLLHQACLFNMSAEAMTLIRMGINIHIINSDGDSALHLACGNALEDVCEELLKRRAHPILKNNSGKSSLNYACQLGNARILGFFKELFSKYEWEAVLTASLVELERDEEAKGVVSGLENCHELGNYFIHAVKLPKLMVFLISNFRELINKNLVWIRKSCSSLGLEQKLGLLQLMHPADIVSTVSSISEKKIERWLRQMIVVEEIPGEPSVRNTVEGAIREVNEVWIPNIEWNSDDPDNGYLVNRISFVLGKIPLPTLSAMAMSAELCPLLEPCIRIMNFDQICVVLPHLSNERFISVVKAHPIQEQIALVKAATDEQNLQYIKVVALLSSPVVKRWHYGDHEELCRGLEFVEDARYANNENPRALFEKLLAKFESILLRLPFAVEREIILLKSMKGALLYNCSHISIMRFITNEIDAMIYKNSVIQTQIDRFKEIFYKDVIYHELMKEIPDELSPEFLCGILKEPMTHPVTACHTFQKEAISEWLKNSKECPICRQKVTIDDFKDNEELRLKIENS